VDIALAWKHISSYNEMFLVELAAHQSAFTAV
jgi:hypothetical protein